MLDRRRRGPNDVAEYELRIGRFRVFYDVDEKVKMVKLKPLVIKEAADCLYEARSTRYEKSKCLD